MCEYIIIVEILQTINKPHHFWSMLRKDDSMGVNMESAFHNYFVADLLEKHI